jgi:hypothetical protein
MRAGTGRAWWVVLSLALGCGDDVRFLPLDQLCAELVSDLCDARDGCCDPEPRAACEVREQRACAARQQSLEAEPLTYDAEAAARQRSAARAALDACEPAPSLSAFFRGGLALGAACERDARCQSALCALASRTCVEALARPLCAVP